MFVVGVRLPHATVCYVYHTPLGRHSMVDISTVSIVGIVGIVGIVPVPKRLALETSRRQLSEEVSFGMLPTWLSSNRALGKLPQGGRVV